MSDRVGDRRVGASFALIAFAALSIGRVALAQETPVEQARQLYLEANFEEAIEAFGRVLEGPEASAADAAQAHLYLAALHTMLGAEDRAARHARAAVAFDPDATAPAGSPPEVQTALEAAREQNGSVPLAVTLDAEGELRPGLRARFRAALTPRGVPFVEQLRLRCTSGETSDEAQGPPTGVSLELMATPPSVSCEASAHTAAGARLVSSTDSWATVSDGATSDEGPLIGGLLAAGGGLLLVGAIVLIAVLATAPQDASLGAPSVVGW